MTTTTTVLSPEQRDYLESIAADVQRMIAGLLRSIPRRLQDDACCTAALEFCRRFTALTPEPLTPGKLPASVVSAVHWSCREAKRQASQETLRQADVMTVAIDVAAYRHAIAAEPYLASTIIE